MLVASDGSSNRAATRLRGPRFAIGFVQRLDEGMHGARIA